MDATASRIYSGEGQPTTAELRHSLLLPSTELYQSSGPEKRKTREYMGRLLFDRHSNEYELTKWQIFINNDDMAGNSEQIHAQGFVI
jgi:hypothetical protein